MSGLKSWEYDDAMHDYLRWQEELESLLKDEESDKEEVEKVKQIIAGYEAALFDKED